MTVTAKTEKLTETVGAEVVGVDLDQLLHDEEFPAWCLAELDAHGALVFRDLHLDDDTQIAFSSRLGEVEKVGRGERPEIFVVTLDPEKNRSAQYLKGTFFWHIDGMTEEIPIKATLLSARAVAGEGGETEFASTYAAWDDLSGDEKERFDDLRVVHTIEASQRLFNTDPSPEEVEIWRRRPAKEHPLVWHHRNRRRSLVLGATTDRVVGMEPDESRAFLDDLLARATAPERVYRHEWQVGDLVIWDNRGVLHRALPYEPTSPRDMHRCTLVGDEPVTPAL